MIPYRRSGLAAVISLCAAFPAFAQGNFSQGNAETSTNTEETYIYGEPGKTDSATNLELSIMETPQIVSTISRAQLDDFGLTKVNSVLDYAPGITVEEVETNRTYYTARGFDIVNFQYDGVGIPFIAGLNYGQQDTALYEKVEVVKGAAGLVTGLANPAATINYVRKRPTEETQISLGTTFGRWAQRRIEGDISGAITPFAAGRLVLAYEEGESHLDRHEDQTNIGYGVLAFDLTDSTKLTVGYSHDDSYSTGVLWGALPLQYTDFTQTDFDVSTSTAPEWAYADNEQSQIFVEFKQGIGDRWSFNAHFSDNDGIYDSKWFYVTGALGRETGLGLTGLPNAYKRKEEQRNTELFVEGDFDLFGQSHQLVVGYSHSDTHVKERSYSSSGGWILLGSDWAAGNTPLPVFDAHDPVKGASDVDLRQKALYAAARLNVLDNVSVLLGVRNTELEQSGLSYGGDAAAQADEIVPYYGLTWEVIDDLVLYSSYNEVFKQQTWVDTDLLPLGPTLGSSTEYGFKKSFNDERATLSVARFESEQDNFGVYVGLNESEIAIYQGVNLRSSGYEIELAGELVDGLNIGAGYTRVDIEDAVGQDARPFIPSKMVTLSASYTLPFAPGVRLGGVVKWQDDTTTPSKSAKQDAYALLDLAVHYQVNKNIDVSLNMENVTDEKYLNSLYWEQGYYGAPPNLSASIRWKL